MFISYEMKHVIGLVNDANGACTVPAENAAGTCKHLAQIYVSERESEVVTQCVTRAESPASL